MPGEVPLISQREREILKLVATGATNQQIAQQLNISIHTVKVHLRNVFGKIGVASRTEATVYAIQQGLVYLDGDDTPHISQPDIAESSPQERAPGAAPAVTEENEEVAQSATHPAQPDIPATAPMQAPQPVWVSARAAPSTRADLPAVSYRKWLVAALVIISSILLVGGLVYTQLQLQQTALQTPPATSHSVNRWLNRAPIPRPRTSFAVTSYDLDGAIYVIGGKSAGQASKTVERYTPDEDTWVRLSDKPTAVSHVHAEVVRGNIYVPGGEGINGITLNILEAYDPRTQQWTSLPPMPAPRSRYALASSEGRLYVFGGWDGTTYRAETFIYNPEDNQWLEGAPMSIARHSAGAAVIAGYIYVMGGTDEQGALQINERYAPTATTGGAWTRSDSLPVPVAAPAIVGIANLILAFDPQNNTAMQYVPARNAWTTVHVPETIDVSSRATISGTKVFVFGDPGTDTSGMLSEYQAVYTTFFPNAPNP